METHEQYEFLLNEIEIMKKLDHPNIARLANIKHTRFTLGVKVGGVE